MMKTCLLIEHGRMWEEAIFTGQNQRNGNPTDAIWVIKAQDKHKAPYPLRLTRHRQTSAKGKLQPGPWNLIVSFLKEEGGHSRFMCSSFTHSTLIYLHTQSLDKCFLSMCHLTGLGADPGCTEMSEMSWLPFLEAWGEQPESDSKSQK